MAKKEKGLFDITKIIKEGDTVSHDSMVTDVLNFLDDDDNFSKRHDVVSLKLGKVSYKMKYSNLLSTLILLKPFVDFKEVPSDEFILFDIDSGKNPILNDRELNAYFNDIIITLTTDYELLNTSFAYIIKRLVEVSAFSNYRIGNTISVWTFYDLYKKLPKNKSKELIDLLYTRLDMNSRKQIKEHEDDLNAKNDKMIEILRDNDSHFSRYLIAGAGINTKQLKQCIVSCGHKPDMDDTIIEEPINANFLTGLQTLQDYFISCKATRNALNTNHKKVKDSGYLTRKLSLLTMDTIVDNDLEDCETSNYINAYIDSKDTLQRLNGRIYFEPETGDEYLIETADEDMIGQNIFLRSPITCAGKKICRKCYGEQLAEINKKRHVGILGVLNLTAILTQMLLSSKHLLQARVNQIEWGESFDKYFSFDRNGILINNEIEDMTGTVVINFEDLIEDETTNEDNFFIEKLYIKDKEGNMECVNFMNQVSITPTFMELLENNIKDSEYEIAVKDIPLDMTLFSMVINNIGLASSLQSILDLIENNEHLGLSNIHDIYNKFIELLNINGINLNSVHIELILRNLIRDSKDLYSRPDFTREVTEADYKVLRVKEANIKNESITVSLAFEELERQLLEPDSYRKVGSSILDPIFIR